MPPTRSGVLTIEGMPETTTLVLERALDRYAVFYRPRDLVPAAGEATDSVDLWFRRYGPGGHRVATIVVHRSRRDLETTDRQLAGLHGDRWFWITRRYPLEMADGMAPRLKAIHDSWVWTDTGQPLDSVGPASPR